MMPGPYAQLILVNALLGVLFATVVLGAPLPASLAGGCGAAALLYAYGPAGRWGRDRRRTEKPTAPPQCSGREQLDLDSGRRNERRSVGLPRTE